VSTAEEGGQEEGISVAIGGSRICWFWTTKLVEVTVGGAHKVGKEGGVGGEGQQF
jgi:hypothetical protein